MSPSDTLVTGVGQCSLDYLALVDSYPAVDTKKEVLQWSEQGGGPVATALVTLARLGLRTRFHGIVGEDEAGHKIRRSLLKEGVDVSGLMTRIRGTSQVAFIAVERGTAQRTIFWRRAKGSELTAHELGNRFLDGASILLLDGLMPEVSLFAARKARSMLVPSVLDAGRLRPGMLELARTCDYVVASEEFARDLDWEVTEEALGKERESHGIQVLTVTRGGKGNVTVWRDGSFRVDAFAVEAVDTTGAGDVFHGGFIYGLLRQWSLRESVIFASAVAALKCTEIGGRAGIPRLPEVMAFLQERGYVFSDRSPR